MVVQDMGRKAKLKVAEVAKVSVQDLNTMLDQYAMTCQLQDWLKKRRDAGLPLPSSMHEVRGKGGVFENQD